MHNCIQLYFFYILHISSLICQGINFIFSITCSYKYVKICILYIPLNLTENFFRFVTLIWLSHKIQCKKNFWRFYMSDLAATNCGGGCSCNEGGCNSILWIIILLCCCGGNGGFCGGNNGCGGSNDCLWIILLLFCCGGCGGNGGGCFC